MGQGRLCTIEQNWQQVERSSCYIYPVIAFGQQQEGKAMAMAERLMLLINGKFGTTLQAILTLYVPSLRQQQPQRE